MKSQRYIEHDEVETDLRVPKSTQDFVYKKMSRRIEESVEFVEFSDKKSKKKNHSDDEMSGIRLLKDTDPITKIDLISEDDMKPNKGTKFELKRRIVEPDGYSQEEKIRMTVIDGESILKQTEIKGWKLKKVKPNKMFNYRAKKSIVEFIEPENEFSALRKKNNWNESKIANSPWKTYKK